MCSILLYSRYSHEGKLQIVHKMIAHLHCRVHLGMLYTTSRNLNKLHLEVKIQPTGKTMCEHQVLHDKFGVLLNGIYFPYNLLILQKA